MAAKLHAVRTLGNLCFEYADNRTKIQAAGGLDAVVATLKEFVAAPTVRASTS
jgi:hypothetical protein